MGKMMFNHERRLPACLSEGSGLTCPDGAGGPCWGCNCAGDVMPGEIGKNQTAQSSLVHTKI